MTDRELMQQALDVMEAAIRVGDWEIDGACDPDWVLNALRARLAQPEQDPVAWADKYDIERDGHDFWVSRQQPAKNGVPLYTTSINCICNKGENA